MAPHYLFLKLAYRLFAKQYTKTKTAYRFRKLQLFHVLKFQQFSESINIYGKNIVIKRLWINASQHKELLINRLQLTNRFENFEQWKCCSITKTPSQNAMNPAKSGNHVLLLIETDLPSAPIYFSISVT